MNKTRILFVEDDDALRETVAALLSAEGYDVVAIDEGSEAVSLLESMADFDLLITDIGMPNVNGLDVIKSSHELRPNMDILVVSALLNEETVDKITKLGAAGYIKKPFSLQDILDPVNALVLRRTRGG